MYFEIVRKPSKTLWENGFFRIAFYVILLNDMKKLFIEVRRKGNFYIKKEQTLQTEISVKRGSTYPCPWAVYLGVPLLAVQAHLHTLTDEETHPHDDIADRALSLVVHGEVECH